MIVKAGDGRKKEFLPLRSYLLNRIFGYSVKNKYDIRNKKNQD